MKWKGSTSIEVYDTQDVVDAFMALDLKEKQARILTYIMQHKDGVTQREIERNLDLRQPEVSHYINTLQDWVRINATIENGRARPINVYVPVKTPKEIAKELRATKVERMRQVIRVIEGMTA